MFTIPFHKTRSGWHDRPTGCLVKYIILSWCRFAVWRFVPLIFRRKGC